jgi:hypothetical protein
MKNLKVFFFIVMALCMYYISMTTIMEKHIFEGICYFVVGVSFLMLSLLKSETQD